MKNMTKVFLLLLCFSFLAVDAKSQFLTDSELNVDLYGYGRYMSVDPGSDVKAIIGSFGMEFKSGYVGFIGVDAGLYMNLGYGKGGTDILEPDPGDEEHRVLDINLAAIKTRFEGDGLRWDLRGGFTPINVGTIGTAGSYRDYTPVNTANLGKMRGLNRHSYTGIESTLEIIQDRLELSYGIANKYSPESHEGMLGFGRTQAPKNKKISFIHSAGVKYTFGMKNDAVVDVGIGHSWNYRQNIQGYVLYPIHFATGSFDIAGYGHIGRFSDESGEDTGNEMHFGISGTFHYEQMLSVKLAYSMTNARSDNSEMVFSLARGTEARHFIQTAARLNDFVHDGESAIQLAVGMKFDRMGVPGLEAGLAYTNGDGYELDYHLYYELKEGPFTGMNFGVYCAHLRNDHGNRDQDDIRGVVGYNFKLR